MHFPLPQYDGHHNTIFTPRQLESLQDLKQLKALPFTSVASNGQICKMAKHPGCQESLADNIYCFRGMFLVVVIPLLLIVFVLCVMPSNTFNESIGDYVLVKRIIFYASVRFFDVFSYPPTIW
ncbi:hypothetical protein VNO78_03634 [Psophocarpus tetragonolobus]|uniref:Uncharacterized protein n=1 Tax=Psophocarpus tetragonolobus TaxID=3891 RepID=A0AAN9XX46_PSOTE